jgi:hypothetical protein
MPLAAAVITSLALRWALSGVFAVCAVLYGAQVRTAPAWQSRAAWSLHTLMALAMIAMAWPWGMHISTIVYVLVFTAGALYFAYLGVFDTHVRHAVYHGSMLASMVLMAVAMSSSALPDTSGAGSISAMPGMNMVGAGGGGESSAAAPIWVTVSCGPAAVFFLGAALWSFFVLVRGPQRPGPQSTYANMLMTAGMGVTFAALAI